MCSSARCANCGKTTWRGCGQHVDAVLHGVAVSDRCHCAQPRPESMFSGLFRRR